MPRLVAPRNVGGFTLLEAIVAMVVFSMGAFALYGWLSTNMITLDRIRVQQQQEVAFASALDLIRRSNPMQSPAGQRSVGDVTVTWSSKLVEPIKPNVDQSGMPGNFNMGLYDVRVVVSRDGRPLGRMLVRQVGWKQTGRSVF